jgi:hypothetical protein
MSIHYLNFSLYTTFKFVNSRCFHALFPVFRIRIRIQMGQRIQIRIGIPDLDQGRANFPYKKGKVSSLLGQRLLLESECPL